MANAILRHGNRHKNTNANMRPTLDLCHCECIAEAKFVQIHLHPLGFCFVCLLVTFSAHFDVKRMLLSVGFISKLYYADGSIQPSSLIANSTNIRLINANLLFVRSKQFVNCRNKCDVCAFKNWHRPWTHHKASTR